MKMPANIAGPWIQEWPVTSHRMMMMGNGMPIAQSRIDRMNLSR